MKIISILLFIVFLLTGCGIPPQVSKPSSKIPLIPHQVIEGTDCLFCHNTGNNGAKQTPHPERSNCTSCHKPAS